MYDQQKGKQYEVQLCNEVYTYSRGQLFPEPVGYSGNHNIPAPDVRIDDGRNVHAIELKRSKKDRISVNYDPDDKSKDDLYQLFKYCREFPRTVTPYIGIRFTNRQLILLEPWLRAPTDRAVLRSATKKGPIDVRLTPSDNLSIHKPDTDIWTSAQSGNDAKYLCDTINFSLD